MRYANYHPSALLGEPPLGCHRWLDVSVPFRATPVPLSAVIPLTDPFSDSFLYLQTPSHSLQLAWPMLPTMPPGQYQQNCWSSWDQKI